jgi:HPt (histidine-containing phosphotransfer) domain-containing protein
MPEESPLDAATLRGLRALDPTGGDEVLREIAAIYLEDTPLRLRELDDAAAAKQTERFIRAAHSLKGSSASLGVTAMRIAAEKAESAARTSGLAAGIVHLPALRAAWESSEAPLRRLLG